MDPNTNTNFNTMGLAKGDIVIIDDAGVVGKLKSNLLERGERPYGDVSIIERTFDGKGGTPYIPGRPAPLDDNRGFYRIKKIDADGAFLQVRAGTELGGIYGSDVTFPKNSQAKETWGYAIYPTIHDSPVTNDGVEGQLDLRPTQYAGLDNAGNPAPAAGAAQETDSYAYSDYSIRPFDYRIIRPTGLISDEAIDLILSVRERMISLIEQFRGALRGDKYGRYFIFQKDSHGRDLGILTVPSTGKGVVSNEFVKDLIGEMDVVPFTSSSDCLAVLDRRFWIQDIRLDTLTRAGNGFDTVLSNDPDAPQANIPGGGQAAVPYTGYTDTGSIFTTGGALTRPLLLDRIDGVLDVSDRLRSQRYAWIVYRAHRMTGILQDVRRFDIQYPAKVKQRQMDLEVYKSSKS